MFDPAKFKRQFTPERSEEYKKAFSGGGGDSYRFFSARRGVKGDHGSFKIRFLPAIPEKFDDGGLPCAYVRVATHILTQKYGQERKDGMTVECILDRTDCAVCEVLEKLAAAKRMGKLSTDICEALDDASAYVRGIWPVAVYGEVVEKTEKGANIWAPSPDKINTALFEVDAISLINAIAEAMDMNPWLAHKERGRWLEFTRDGKSSDPKKRYLLKARDQWKEEKLPDEVSLSQMPDARKVFWKNIVTLNYEEQMQEIQRSWWAQREQVKTVLANDKFTAVPPAMDDADVLPWMS